MIRPLQRADREELRRIIIDTNHFNDEEIIVAMELIDIFLNDEKQRDYINYVYENDNTGKAAGYICYGRRPMTESSYDLYWIAVDPKIHGQGIGSKLVRFMEEDLLLNKNGKLILIETSGKASYENERHFYEKNGYKIQTTIKDFYRTADDLVIYYKYLS